ncbi:MAG TPA: hypothetical protein VK689_13980, partial [Armatimonadota bacterium]|nr:hypothetical protein [Armatimonadota bacterium]
MRIRRATVMVATALALSGAALAQLTADGAALFLDFSRGDEGVSLHHGARHVATAGGALEFTSARQFAEIELPHRLDRVDSASIGGWFFLRRAGEQTLLSRGAPEVGQN